MIVTVLFNGLVQGAAIVAISYFAVRCVPERNASTRCALWFVALLALVFVPVLATVSQLGAQLVDAMRPSAGEQVIVSLFPVGTLARAATQLAAPATLWIVAAWLVGMAVQGLRLMVSFIRIERIRQKAERTEICGERVLVSDDVTIPIAAGLFDPAVILPRTVVETLGPRDLERIVAHERAHIRRNDILGNFVQRLIEMALFFNPWVYVIGRNIAKEREAACDDLAVQRTGTAGEYAECLASLARSVCHKKSPLFTPSALGSSTSVISRIERLVRNGESGATSLNYYSIGGTVVLLAILTLALQTLSPASTLSAYAPRTALSNSPTAVAATCSAPNTGAKVVTAAMPQIPHLTAASHGFVDILVTIAPTGAITRASVTHSSGNSQVDTAVLNAAKSSTYSPARQNCEPVAGNYDFHAVFAPEH